MIKEICIIACDLVFKTESRRRERLRDFMTARPESQTALEESQIQWIFSVLYFVKHTDDLSPQKST